jgi:hypothetical protein
MAMLLCRTAAAIEPGRPLPSSAGMRRDSAYRFFDPMNEWATEARASGLSRSLLIDAIRQGGPAPSGLAANTIF